MSSRSMSVRDLAVARVAEAARPQRDEFAARKALEQVDVETRPVGVEQVERDRRAAALHVGRAEHAHHRRAVRVPQRGHLGRAASS